MQMQWLEAFLAVADHQGFAAASTYLYRSQGRVSSYIASLETELGVQLFDRRQRPARLTSEGSAFLPHARQMLETLDAGRLAALAVRGLARGDVALATYPSASAEFLPGVLRRFSSRYPNVAVQLVERPSDRGLDQALDSGEAWIVVRPTIPPLLCRTAVQYSPLWREQVCVVVSDDHGLAGKSEIQPNDLVGLPLVVGGSNTRDAELSRLLIAAGIEPTIKYLSDQPQTVVALARAGLAAGVINVLALQSLRLDGVSVVPLPTNVTREVGVYWASAVSTSTAASALLDVMLGTPLPTAATDIRRIKAAPFA